MLMPRRAFVRHRFFAPAFRALTTTLTLTLAAGCGTTSQLRPVGAGNTRVTASLGGPLVVFGGAPVPLPITRVGVAHGTSESVDVSGGLHPTAALFGVAGLDAGVAWHPLRAHRSLLALGFDAYGFGNTHDAVFIVDPWLGSHVRVSSTLSLGGGLHVATRAATSASYQRELSPIAPSLFAQAAFHIGRITLEVEPRWYALGQCGQCVAPGYISPGTGALGLVLGVSFDNVTTTNNTTSDPLNANASPPPNTATAASRKDTP